MKPNKFLIFKQLFLRRVQVSYKLFLIKKECIEELPRVVHGLGPIAYQPEVRDGILRP